MINYIYHLIAPKVIAAKFDDLKLDDDGVLVRPSYLALCHADGRYYRGLRPKEVLERKLPMALVHEAVGTVVNDPKGEFEAGDNVILIPNIPGDSSDSVAENYRKDSKFRSSGVDGFMQEYVLMPRDRLVECNGVDLEIAAISEFISVAFQAVNRFESRAVTPKDTIAVWGDGNLGYVVAFVLKCRYPDSKIVVIGQTQSKLQYFTFADETYFDTEVPDNLTVDHAFECTGGDGCKAAIDDIISHINPEGVVMLLGVSENKVPIFTRDVLEKGLTLVGSSRSSYADFFNTVELLKDRQVARRFKTIVSEVIPINSIEDIHTAFERDVNNPFKTVLKWNL